jgi:2'-5' RNA ligase
MPPRPALPRRAVVAFVAGLPDGVEALRREHDPLAAAVPAHVTFVFPFASSLSDVQVAAHVRRIAGRWPVLPVTLSGVDAYDGRWVHVRVTRGRDAVVELHDRLYRGALAPFLRREFDYEPHVTLGRASDAGECAAMIEHARAVLARPVDGVLRALAIVALSAAGDVAIEREIGLGG